MILYNITDLRVSVSSPYKYKAIIVNNTNHYSTIIPSRGWGICGRNEMSLSLCNDYTVHILIYLYDHDTHSNWKIGISRLQNSPIPLLKLRFLFMVLFRITFLEHNTISVTNLWDRVGPKIDTRSGKMFSIVAIIIIIIYNMQLRTKRCAAAVG